MNNKLERIIKKYLGGKESEHSDILYISDNKSTKIKNMKYISINEAKKTISDKGRIDVVILEHDNLNDINEIISKYKEQVGIFILIVNKKFDFDKFIKTANVTFADIYNMKGKDYYYLGVH